jgi:curved DNA-binding protein CbpA
MDEIARAYATLGVPPGTPLGALRKQYKALVRKWHPDRFASDAQGQAEATLRMRAINDAFRLVAERSIHDAAPQGSERAAAADQPSPAHRGEPQFGRRLTREEIDRMVEAMKGDGPLDWILETSWPKPDFNRPVHRRVMAAYVAILVAVIANIVAESGGLVERGNWRITAVAWLIAFPILLRVLPKS